MEGKKDTYLNKIKKLNKNFFKNYWEMEKLIVAQLEKEGKEYFIKNDCYGILARFEPTVKVFCEILEELGYANGGIVDFYLHLNDMKNVKLQIEKGKGNPNFSIYKDFHKYQDSGEVLRSKYVSIKYDKNVRRFAKWVFDQAERIDCFLDNEWHGYLPPVIRVIFMTHRGNGPYNPDLNETYLPVKGMNKIWVKFMTGAIVHETFHLVNAELIRRNCKFGYDTQMNSFKFLDEGYAQLIQAKFSNDTADQRIKADYYSRKTSIKGEIDFSDLLDNWGEAKGYTYALALSFAYFLEDKFGAEKHKNLFLPAKKIKENSWRDYAENYFGKKIDDLVDEWKEEVIKDSSSDKIVESVPVPEFCLSCKKANEPRIKDFCFTYRFEQRTNKKFYCNNYEKAEDKKNKLIYKIK